MATVELVSVNVAQPAYLGTREGRAVESAIAKRPVSAEAHPELPLSLLNLEGDRQADLRVHGGPDKSVYAYPSEHLPAWSQELGLACGPASFGENLTTRGWREHEVRIGDVWRWGSAVLQVSQPRSPCYKLAMRLGRPDVESRLVATGRTGWYLRVLEPGRVPVAGPVEVVEPRPAHQVSVIDAHRAAFGATATAEDCDRVLEVPELARGWRRMVARRTERRGAS